MPWAKLHAPRYDLLFKTVLDESVPLGPGRDPDLAYRKDVDLHIGAALSKLGVPPLDPRSDEGMAQALALIASIPKIIK